MHKLQCDSSIARIQLVRSGDLRNSHSGTQIQYNIAQLFLKQCCTTSNINCSGIKAPIGPNSSFLSDCKYCLKFAVLYFDTQERPLPPYLPVGFLPSLIWISTMNLTLKD